MKWIFVIFAISFCQCSSQSDLDTKRKEKGTIKEIWRKKPKKNFGQFSAFLALSNSRITDVQVQWLFPVLRETLFEMELA